MQQQQRIAKCNVDEIDLADLVSLLVERQVASCRRIAFATLLLAMAYLVLVPRTYTGSFEISALPAVPG